MHRPHDIETREHNTLVRGLTVLILTWLMAAAPTVLRAASGKQLGEVPGGPFVLAAVAAVTAYLILRYTFDWPARRNILLFPYLALWAVGVYLVVREIPSVPDVIKVIFPVGLFVAAVVLRLARL